VVAPWLKRKRKEKQIPDHSKMKRWIEEKKKMERRYWNTKLKAEGTVVIISWY